MTKVLIAEDDHDIRELISLTLQFHGFEATSVSDGQAAVDAAQQADYDVILLDVRMPRMTGYEACRQLRLVEHTRDVPIIFLSAKGQESEIQAGLAAGATAYILKPFAPEMLIKKINEVIN
jgi:DNA-binding response OmpR family regulator